MRCLFQTILAISGLAVLFQFSACTTEEVTEVRGGNQPLPDTLVSALQIESYVNKTYINLLGRKPDEAEFTIAIDRLKRSNASVASRKAVIEEALATDEYYNRVYDVARINLLQNADSAYFQNQLDFYKSLREDPRYADFLYFLDKEIAEMEAWLAAPKELRQGAIDMKGFYRRFVNNAVYDEINMGTENFVLSMYETFLGREPTGAELAAAKSMVDGSDAVLFLEQGTNKDDFLDIFFGSREYHEGRVRALYLNYFFREPDAVEIERYARLYMETNDYNTLQKEILSLDEYLLD